MCPRSPTLAASALALAVFATGPAFAQTSGSVGASRSLADELVIGPDEEVVVREYVVRRARPRVVLQENVRLRPGSLVPAYVELEPMADVSTGRFRQLAYFVSPDDKIVMVDPGTRTVVRIVDR